MVKTVQIYFCTVFLLNQKNNFLTCSGTSVRLDMLLAAVVFGRDRLKNTVLHAKNVCRNEDFYVKN
ncbi:hypothetical protein D7V86_02720 [bacterium D16-51]|nr:hypothetical protein D7V96_02930 [bacterium D16-59]RKI62040.1 hypothetical protein D7V86_02720 [bacterium D16-51]